MTSSTKVPPKPRIFVFGSNLAGRHETASALTALYSHGACYGRGVGFQGSSYAIPTKDYDLKILPLQEIAKYIDDFISFARTHPNYDFTVVRIGCGKAGYPEKQIAPLFTHAPLNCHLPPGWRKLNEPRH